MYFNLDKLRLEIGSEFSISLFVVIIISFVVPVLIKSLVAASNAFKDGARKLNDLYDKLQAKAEYRDPTDKELLEAEGIEVYNEFQSECIDLGCISLAKEIEVCEQTKAIHSVWVNREHGVFIEIFAAYHDNDAFGKAIWRLTNNCEIQLLSDGKPMVPSLPGKLSRRTCDRDASVSKMLDQFLCDFGGQSNEPKNLTIDSLNNIRDRFQEIKELQYRENSGVMSRETLESMSSVKNRYYISKIIKEMRNDRTRRLISNRK